MRERETVGSAFPTDEFMDDGTIKHTAGMTLRDYFAAKVMQGYLSNPALKSDVATPAKIAGWAYEQADEMIAERAK
jgi:hypothetical protein